MANLAPQGAVYQAGTLSGNPVAMAAGLATLRVLQREDGWTRLEELGKQLDELLAPVLEEAPIAARLVRQGSIFWLALQDGNPPRRADAIDDAAADLYGPLFHGLLERGVYLAPSAYEVGFLSLAHRDEHLAKLARALREALQDSGADQ
jgi:glutamate-1-semialdehyde 2,1-aminomutase